MPLNDWQDVQDHRRAADQAAEVGAAAMKLVDPDSLELELGGRARANVAVAALAALNALRLELRVLGITISHALGEATDGRR